MAETPPETVVYVSNAGSKEIHVLAMNRTTGDLELIDKTPVPGTDKPSPTSMPMAQSPDHRFLYAALRSEPFPAASFAIDATSGKLTHLGSAPLADSMAYIITDRAGRYLLSASYPGSKLAINPIDGSGRVQGQATQVLPTKPKAHCVLVDASNKFAYCTNLGGDIIMQMKFDANAGTVAPNEPAEIATKSGAGPRHLAFHPNRRFLYLITETTATIGTYAIDPQNGTLKELQFVNMLPPDFNEQPAAADLHVTPDGRFLYGSERKSSILAGFRIDPEQGTLTPIGRFPTEKTPRGFGIDPRGRFLLSVGLDSNAMTVYAIDQQSGALNPIKHYPMGEMPNWVEFVDLR
ncbi:MAG: lactonase family protein [Alphaproteobacteria bacterium]|nr:lactonase family protein [Alphaproteobacteria bacterium]